MKLRIVKTTRIGGTIDYGLEKWLEKRDGLDLAEWVSLPILFDTLEKAKDHAEIMLNNEVDKVEYIDL